MFSLRSRQSVVPTSEDKQQHIVYEMLRRFSCCVQLDLGILSGDSSMVSEK